MNEIEIADEFIELNKLLKLENWVASGGEAKFLISEGRVKVNGDVETRIRKKIFPGDVVEFEKAQVRVKGQP